MERVDGTNAGDGITVIIPVFNGKETISAAIDSILYQKCRHHIEIIVVDDASTDGTSSVVEKYLDRCDIRIIRNPENRGNAYSFYVGLKNTSTRYWTVLDADDYYSNERKLEIEIDFLEKEENSDYVGVAHNYVIHYGNSTYKIPPLSEITEFDYDDVLTGHIVYCHTSTYVYRNVYNGNPPECFSRKEFRGDTVRTAIILRDTGKKIAVLPMVSSHYIMNGDGIWSSLSMEKRKKQLLSVYAALKSVSETKHEKRGYDYLMFRDKLILGKSVSEKEKNDSMYSVIDWINRRVRAYADSKHFDGYCRSAYFDSIMESMAYPLSVQSQSVPSNIVGIIVTGFGDEIMEKINGIKEVSNGSGVAIYHFGEPCDTVVNGADVIHIFDQETLSSSYERFRNNLPTKTYYLCTEPNYFPLLFFDKDSENNIIVFGKDMLIPGSVHPFTDNIAATDGTVLRQSRDSVCSDSPDVADCRIDGNKDIMRKKMKDFAYVIIEKVVVR